MTGWCFSPVSSTNKTGRQDITEILLKVALNTIKIHPSNPSATFAYEQSLTTMCFILVMNIMCI
jgi:hypothetical protein